MATYQDVITFWFEKLTPEQYWAKDIQLDQTIKTRFMDVHNKAVRGELFEWRNTPQGRLAEIIVRDQFSRNIYRDLPGAFASDPMALVLAQVFVASGNIMELPLKQRTFAIMPYMHSESLLIHDQALLLFGDPDYAG